MSEQDLAARVERLLQEKNGPACAAALVGSARCRRLLHQRGWFDATVRLDAEEPAWVAFAVEHLRRRKGWSVVVFTHRAKRVYRVTWTAWPHWPAASAFVHPAALRRRRA